MKPHDAHVIYVPGYVAVLSTGLVPVQALLTVHDGRQGELLHTDTAVTAPPGEIINKWWPNNLISLRPSTL